MQPTTEDIAKLAIYDPVAAFGMLMGIPRIPFSTSSKIISFTNFALNTDGTIQNVQPIVVPIDAVIAYRTWIDNLTYSLSVTGVDGAAPPFGGSVFQPFWLAQLRKSTGVNIKAEVMAGPKYLVMEHFTPLENFINVFRSAWPAGWPIYKQQSIQVKALLTALPGGSSSSLGSYNVKITWNGWQFIDPSLDEMTGDEARVCLRKQGIYVPQDMPRRQFG